MLWVGSPNAFLWGVLPTKSQQATVQSDQVAKTKNAATTVTSRAPLGGGKRSRYRLRAVRLVRGEEGHFHPNDVKFALLVVSANAFKGRAGRHVIVICENFLCLIRPSQLSLLEEPFDLLLKEVTEPEWNSVIELFDKTCLFLSACVIYRRYIRTYNRSAHE